MAVAYSEFKKNSLRLRILAVMLVFSSIRPSSGQAMEVPDSSMDAEEVEAVYRVLEGINHEIDWRSMFPGNPCTGGPHGVNCDIYNNTWHVVEFNLGWVSDTVNNPPCSDNATIDRAIFQFSHLKKLFFYNCFTKVAREIPPEIWKLASSLQHLTLQSNSALVGEIPMELGNLTHLERLVLSENCLTGFIPVEIGNLKKLQQLVMSRNQLTGHIPNSLKNLNSLKILDLSGNNLAGGIPPSLGGLNAVQKLDLSENLLNGNIPFEMGNLVSLQFLDLSSNKLNGGIPDSLHKLRNLEYLSLSANLLGGRLPEFWGNLTNLMGLKLANSCYYGRIPDSLGLLQQLNFLDLENNRLVGRIPSSLGKLSSLYHLNLSFNLLSGPILFPLQFMGRLQNHLNFQNNSGLCYQFSLRNVSSIDLVQCSSSSSSSTQIQPLSSKNVDKSYVASKGKAAEAITLLCSSIVLCLSML